MTNHGVSSRRILFAGGAVVALLTVAGAVTFVDYAKRHAPNPRRVAVAPFDIFASGLDAWRVGLAEGLTTRLQEMPLLEAVPQSVVKQTWRSATRPEIAAVELARRTSAGVAVYARVDSLAGVADSVRVSLVAVDATSTKVLFGVLLRHPTRDADDLAAKLAEHVRHNLDSAVTAPHSPPDAQSPRTPATSGAPPTRRRSA